MRILDRYSHSICLTILVVCFIAGPIVRAQNQKGKERPPVTRVELEGDKPTPMPTPLPVLTLSQEQLQRLALAEAQITAAQQAYEAAQARHADLVKALFLEKGGTLVDYELKVQQLDQRTWGFLPKAKAQPEKQ